MEIRRRHWLISLFIAFIAHASLVLVFYKGLEPPAAGAEELGLSGIEIALGPANPPAPEPEPEVEPAPEPQPIAEPEPIPQPEPVPVPIPEPVAEPEPTPEPTPIEVPVQRNFESATWTVKPRAVSPEPPPEPVAQIDPAPPGNTGDNSAGGGIPGAKRDYLTILSAWLEKHKRYPARAQRRRQEGTTYLRLVLDRAGQVISYRIEKTSGYSMLDEEVEALIERAKPLPAMPPEMEQNRMELIVPVAFVLR